MGLRLCILPGIGLRPDGWLMESHLTPLTGKARSKSFAVFDLETTTNLDKAFLLGFYDGNDYKVFEAKRGNESRPYLPDAAEGPVSQFLSWLFTSRKYTKHWLYAHNGGNFDFLYLVSWLLKHDTEYSFNAIPLQSSILRLEVRRKVEGNKKNPWVWTFLDSYRLMNAPLEKLGKGLVGAGKTVKVHADGTLVNEKVVAEIQRYYNELHFNPQRYEYLKQDCQLLYRCLKEFYSRVMDAGGEIGMTAPSSAMKSFRRMHLRKWIPINRCFPGCDCEG